MKKWPYLPVEQKIIFSIQRFSYNFCTVYCWFDFQWNIFFSVNIQYDFQYKHIFSVWFSVQTYFQFDCQWKNISSVIFCANIFSDGQCKHFQCNFQYKHIFNLIFGATTFSVWFSVQTYCPCHIFSWCWCISFCSLLPAFVLYQCIKCLNLNKTM